MLALIKAITMARVRQHTVISDRKVAVYNNNKALVNAKVNYFSTHLGTAVHTL